MAGSAFFIGLIALIAGIVRARRSEKGTAKRKRSRTLAWIGAIAMVYGFATLPPVENAPEQAASPSQEKPSKAASEPAVEVNNSTGPFDPVDVRIACEDGIKGLLAAPNTAKFVGFWDTATGNYWGNPSPERSGDNTFWYWNVEVDSQNLFGVPLTTHWSCIFGDDGKWTVEQVE